jgi:Septum formation initiator
LSKVATTYWDNSKAVLMPERAARTKPQARTRSKALKREKTSSHWLVFTVIVALSSMICLTVNLRAYSELREEIEQHRLLNAEVDQLTNENLALQKEIQSIKTDSATIEQEARKLGMSRPNEKILVPAN